MLCEFQWLRYELEECKRDNDAAMDVATGLSANAFAAKKACKDRESVRRGPQGSSEPRESASYKRWFGKQVDILSKFIGGHFNKNVFFPSFHPMLQMTAEKSMPKIQATLSTFEI